MSFKTQSLIDFIEVLFKDLMAKKWVAQFHWCVCMCACVCAEWNIPVSPVHTLRNEVQPDVQGQPDRTHSGGGSAEHLSSWGEWGLRYSCCHKGDTCNNTLTCQHTHQCIKAPCLATLSMSVTCVYLKGRVRNTRSRVQPCLQDKRTFSFHCLSFRYTLSAAGVSQLFVDTVLLSHFSFRETIFLHLWAAGFARTLCN